MHIARDNSAGGMSRRQKSFVEVTVLFRAVPEDLADAVEPINPATAKDLAGFGGSGGLGRGWSATRTARAWWARASDPRFPGGFGLGRGLERRGDVLPLPLGKSEEWYGAASLRAEITRNNKSCPRSAVAIGPLLGDATSKPSVSPHRTPVL